MPIAVDYRRMVPPISRELVESYREKIRAIHGDLLSRRKAGTLPFYDLPRQDLAPIETYAARVRGGYKNVVVLGIGGSALGLLSLNSALRSPFPALEPAPRLAVMDNIDPVRIDAHLKAMDPRETILNVITKSGDTAETMSEFLVFRKWFTDALGTRGAKDRIVVTTDRSKGALRKIANDEGYASFEVPDGVGGRFSVLTPVGLLPAALLGIDIRALLAGAAAMDKRLSSGELLENPAYLGAALHHAAWHEGRRISVMFAYADQLYLMADWYRQLWAESLGKRRATDGRIVSAGPTPIKALGVTDQHSQVQLYKEGPDDKIYTFLAVESFDATVTIPSAPIDAVSYLGGHSMNELLAAEELATAVALWKAGRPVTRIVFPRVSAENVGEYYHLLEVETVAAGALFGIDPLDQPGVEEGKQFAYGIMGRPGYETKRREVEDLAQGDPALLFSAERR
ncbi:MAG TPA: glucose-6-phosphate isomerase [Spirochaetia bacterium]|nr:glucose-6-phosphate isomerase [Spirochaetia bacterium]